MDIVLLFATNCLTVLSFVKEIFDLKEFYLGQMKVDRIFVVFIADFDYKI